MRVDYDKDLLASLIKKAGGDLRLVERALGLASRDKSSSYVSGADVEAAIRKIAAEDRAAAAPGRDPSTGD